MLDPVPSVIVPAGPAIWLSPLPTVIWSLELPPTMNQFPAPDVMFAVPLLFVCLMMSTALASGVPPGLPTIVTFDGPEATMSLLSLPPVRVLAPLLPSYSIVLSLNCPVAPVMCTGTVTLGSTWTVSSHGSVALQEDSDDQSPTMLETCWKVSWRPNAFT